MFEAKEVLGKPEATSKLNLRKVFAEQKYKTKAFFDAERAILRYKQQATPIADDDPVRVEEDTETARHVEEVTPAIAAVDAPKDDVEEDESDEEEDEWLDFDDLFPSPHNSYAKSMSSSKQSRSEQEEDGTSDAFPAFPEFDVSVSDIAFQTSKSALGFGDSDFGTGATLDENGFEVTQPTRSGSLGAGFEVAQPTRSGSLGAGEAIKVDDWERAAPSRSVSLDADSKLWGTSKGVPRRTVASTKPKRATLAYSPPPLRDESPIIRRVGRSSSMGLGSSNKHHTITMELSKPDRASRKSRSPMRSPSNSASLFGSTLAEEQVEVPEARRTRSLDANFSMFDEEADAFDDVFRNQTFNEKGSSSSSSRTSQHSPSLSPLVRAPKGPIRIGGSVETETSSSDGGSSLHHLEENDSATTTTTTEPHHQAVHPSRKVQPSNDALLQFNSPTFSSEPFGSDADIARNSTKSQSLKVSMARRRASMEDFASGANWNVSIKEFFDEPKASEKSSSPAAHWNAKANSVPEEGTVSSFTHVSDELSSTIGGGGGATSSSPLPNRQMSLPDLTEEGGGLASSQPPSPPQRGLDRIQSARLKVRTNEEKMTSLFEENNDRWRSQSSSSNSLNENNMDEFYDKEKAASVDGSNRYGHLKEKRKFTLFPNKQKTPDFLVGRKRNQVSPASEPDRC
eukprot:scaffold4905_cov98-Cylindrotheca_fusiformis.AAC.9